MSWYWPPNFASSGFGIQVGQYTGASTLFASACQPFSHCAGHVRLPAAPAPPAAVNASAAAAATSRALMRDRVARLNVGGKLAGQGCDVPRGDDHGVAPGLLELLRLARRDEGQVGDRELARRHGGEQIEHDLERRLVIF